MTKRRKNIKLLVLSTQDVFLTATILQKSNC